MHTMFQLQLLPKKNIQLFSKQIELVSIYLYPNARKVTNRPSLDNSSIRCQFPLHIEWLSLPPFSKSKLHMDFQTPQSTHLQQTTQQIVHSFIPFFPVLPLKYRPDAWESLRSTRTQLASFQINFDPNLFKVSIHISSHLFDSRFAFFSVFFVQCRKAFDIHHQHTSFKGLLLFALSMQRRFF